MLRGRHTRAITLYHLHWHTAVTRPASNHHLQVALAPVPKKEKKKPAPPRRAAAYGSYQTPIPKKKFRIQSRHNPSPFSFFSQKILTTGLILF